MRRVPRTAWDRTLRCSLVARGSVSNGGHEFGKLWFLDAPSRGSYAKMCAVKHRATGRPRGRPPKLPAELPEQVMCDLESRMDKTTLLVAPQLGPLAKKLNISRSSLKRIVVSLRNSGFIELCHVKKRPTDKIFTILYKLPRSLKANDSVPCGS